VPPLPPTGLRMGVYGDKIHQEITGKDGEPFHKKETPLETARWIAWILNRARVSLHAVGEEAAGEPAGPADTTEARRRYRPG
jgi:hypothetical protein